MEYFYLYKEKYKYLTRICLNITDACNLKCKYCFVTQSPHFMTLETAKDIVEWLYNNLQIKKKNNWCLKTEKCTIHFFGGEPMLLYDKIIVPLTNYIKDKYPNDFQLGITTNGTLLDENKIKWFYENNFSILLSIDGARDTQNINRPCQDESKNSFDLVAKNIPYILKYFPDTVFRATIDQSTVEYTFENFLFAQMVGFKNIFLIPNGRERWKQENITKLNIEIEKIFIYLKDCFLKNKEFIHFSVIDEVFNEILLQNDIISGKKSKIIRNKIRNIEHCGLGTISGSIGYNGNIYGCQEQDSQNLDSIFYLGNIYKDGIEQDRHETLLKAWAYCGENKSENRELCFNCLLKNICNSYACPSSSSDCFNDFSIVPEIHCVWRNSLFFNALKIFYFLYNQENKNFINYIEKIKNKGG